jgi:hypothetical protein
MDAINKYSPEKVRELSNDTVRRPTAMVDIEWAGGAIDDIFDAYSEDENRVSYPDQTHDGTDVVPFMWFHAGGGNPKEDKYNKLDGSFHAMPDNGNNPYYQVGWRGKTNADDNGNYAPATILTQISAVRTLRGLRVAGDTAVMEYPVKFKITANGGEHEFNVPDDGGVFDPGRCAWTISFSETWERVLNLEIIVERWSEPNTFVKITEVSSIYNTAHGSDEILSLSILEETESSGASLPIGNISCNEIDLTLMNIGDRFSPFNEDSPLHTVLVRNRRIVPYLGFIDKNGDKHFVPKGLYWTGDWASSEQGTGTTVTARDRLSVLQDINYTGFRRGEGVECDGYCDDENSGAEYTRWLNISAYDLLEKLLLHIRVNHQQDLYYDIDGNLKDVILPIAFFSEQSYFDVLKDIAQVSLSYIYMDTPTQEELEAAGQYSLAAIKDVLRVAAVKDVFKTDAAAGDISITARDYTTRTQPADADNLANRVTVLRHEYAVDSEGKIDDVEGSPFSYTADDEESIKRYGVAPYEYQDNHLIQSEAMASEIANAILDMFSKPYRNQSLNAFGDPTLSILDTAEVPEYQKFNFRTGNTDVVKKGLYVVKKIQTEFDGGIRQSIDVRKLRDINDEDIIGETGDAPEIIDESGAREELILETGR